MLKERGRKILSADFRLGRSDAVEAARQPLLDAGGLDRIARCRELFRQQSQLLRAEAVSFSFRRTQFCPLQPNFLARRPARRNPPPGQRPPKRPRVTPQPALASDAERPTAPNA